MTTTSSAVAAATSAVTPVSPFGDLSLLPHDSKKPDIIASGVITLFLAGCFVAARFYTRALITRKPLGASEWLVLSAWIFSFGVTIPQILETGYGMGAHVYDLPESGFNFSGNAEAGLISIFFYSLSLTFSKFSILALYILVFPYTWVRSVSFFLIAVVAASQTWVLYVIFSACTPLQAFWDMTIQNAKCHPQSYWLANQYQMIASDFMIFLLPLPVVWRLKVRPGQKILLVFVFTMGFFVCAISIIRISLIIPLTNNPGPDFTYSGVSTYYWTDIETNLAIVVAASLTLKPFVSKLLPRSRFGAPDDDSGGHGVQQPARVRLSPLHHSLINPIITFGSRLSRRTNPQATTGNDNNNGVTGLEDDTKALRGAPSSHVSRGSSSHLDNYSPSTSGNRTILDRHGNAVDEEMGLPMQGAEESKPHLHANVGVRSLPADR